MTMTDVRGLELTTTSPEALEHYNHSIAANAEYRLSAGDYIMQAIEADPNFTMAHCVLGYYMKGAEALAPPGAAKAALEAAEATDLSRVTPRERASVQALRAWVEGRQDDAITIWDKILDEHPTDLLTMQLVHYRNFWHGKAMSIRDSVARQFHAWTPDMPNYSNILGMYSFGLNETGNKKRALELGMQATDMNKDDLWAVHAVSHVLNDTGEQERGLAYLDQFDKTWEGRNAIREHLWWHEGLFQWELGNYDKVLELYDNSFAKNISPFYLDVQNSSSILWRLESCDVDVGDRWQKLSDVAAQRLVNRNIPFTDIHVAMVLGRTGQQEGMKQLLSSVNSDVQAAQGANQMAAAETDMAVCEAIDAYCRQDYDTAIDKMLPGRWNAYRPLGASDAQRDVLGVMLGQAALKSGNFNMARSVFAQRLEEKPSNKMSWLWYASALENSGNPEGAKAARNRAQALTEKMAA